MSLCSLTGPMYCDASAFIMGSARYLPSHYGAVSVREPVCYLCDIRLSSYPHSCGFSPVAGRCSVPCCSVLWYGVVRCFVRGKLIDARVQLLT